MLWYHQILSNLSLILKANKWRGLFLLSIFKHQLCYLVSNSTVLTHNVVFTCLLDRISFTACFELCFCDVEILFFLTEHQFIFPQYCFLEAPLRSFSWLPCKLCDQQCQRVFQFCCSGETFGFCASLQSETPSSHGAVSISSMDNNYWFLPSHSMAFGSDTWQKAVSVQPHSLKFLWVWARESVYPYSFGFTAFWEIHFFHSSQFEH